MTRLVERAAAHHHPLTRAISFNWPRYRSIKPLHQAVVERPKASSNRQVRLLRSTALAAVDRLTTIPARRGQDRPHRAAPYYGWYIAITLALTETISWGIIYYSFSVFLTPMQSDLGWTRSELTGAFSLSLLVAGAMAFPVGAWIDRHGPRLLMTIGSVTASVLVIAWSQVSDRTTLYLIWIGLGASAAAVLYDPAFAVIAQWFNLRRSTALAIVTFAAGFASTIFLPLSDGLLHAFGWRTAILLLGIFLGVMTIPLHALKLRRHPHALGLLPDGMAKHSTEKLMSRPDASFRSAMHSRVFWLLVLSFGLAYLSAAAIRVHFIPFLIGSGVDSSTAAFATGAIGIMQVAGRVLFVPLERRWSNSIMVIGVFALQAVATAILVIGQAPMMIGLFIILFGAAQGTATLARSSILAELYGSANYGRIASVMTVCLTLANTSAPLGASLIFDQTGSYRPVLWIVLILALAAATVAFVAKHNITHRQMRAAIEPHDAILAEGMIPGDSS
jgi:MFS family permease